MFRITRYNATFWGVRVTFVLTPLPLQPHAISFEESFLWQCVEIKCQLDATDGFFIADLIACSTCFRHHYIHNQELTSIIQWLLPVVFGALVFKLSVWFRTVVVCPVCQHPANRTHNPQLYTRPKTWKPQYQIPHAATTCIILLSS